MQLPRGNRLLDLLRPGEAERILPTARVVSLVRDQETTMCERPMTHVDFPVTALMTVKGLLSDGTVYEVASVGSEGFVEIDAALRHDYALRSAACQFDGEAIRVDLADFRSTMEHSETFATLVLHAVRARAYITEQMSLCNLRHTIVQRFARWLLLARDRLAREDFDVTQDFVATILGVRRAGVSAAAAELEAEGAIVARRGLVTIADPVRLEAIACECYAVCRDTLTESLSRPRR